MINPSTAKNQGVSKTFNEFLQARGLATRTIHEYERYIKSLSEALTVPECSTYLAKAGNNRMARGALKALLEFKQRHDVTIPRLTGHQRVPALEKRCLTIDELSKLYTKLPARELLIARTCFEGALRITECLSLRLNQLDFINHRLNGFGKGGREYVTVVSEKTMNGLKRWCELQKITEPDTLLFQGYGKQGYITYQRTLEVLRKASLEALSKKIAWHYMKRTRGLDLQKKGYSLEQRMIALHHASPLVTQRHYSSLDATETLKKLSEDVKEFV